MCTLFFVSGPLLLWKKRRVDFCKEEIIMILRAYRAHPTCWADVVEDVKSNLNVLPEPTRQLYETGSDRQLKDRISSKLGRLVAAGANIQDEDIRREVDLVRALERQHVDQPALVDEPNLGNEEPNFNQPLDRNRGQAALNPEPVDNQPEPAQVRPADRRDAIAADLSDPEDEPPRQRRRNMLRLQMFGPQSLDYTLFLENETILILQKFLNTI
ncbi:hypothetical protein ACF0H5_009999 [Mactra antiquata]